MAEAKIELYDWQLTGGLPRVLCADPAVLAISAACRKQTRRLLDYAERAKGLAAVDSLPEGVLDRLAFDLKVPEYSISLGAATKRALIKGAAVYWSKAGTKQAVVSLVKEFFGDALMLEWFDYNEEPGYFKVTTTSPTVTEENVTEFKLAVEAIKRFSSHLRSVELLISAEPMMEYSGFILSSADFVSISQIEE